MLISTKRKKIVLNSRHPERLCAVIPTAKPFKYKGVTLVAIPHRPTETKILNNMGYEVPEPVQYYYDWPGRFKPFHAQQETVKFMTTHNRAFVLNDMGTGKTMSSLWTFDYLKSEGEARRALIISPLSTLERTWGDEIFSNFPEMNFAVLHGTREKRLKLLEQDVDVYIVNHHGLDIIADAVAKRDDIDTIIVDEIATFRNSGTKLWKALRRATEKKPRVFGLTGTPTPNAPTDAYAQCRIICPSNVPQYYGKFRDQVMRQISQWKWVPRDNALDVVSKAMQPAIRFRRDECVDLPPTTYETRQVEMTKDQQAMYRAMKEKLHTEFDGQTITAVNEAVKMGKLVQIACGVVYDNEGSATTVPATARLAETKEVIEQAGAKVLVFVPYTHALNSVAEYLGEHFTVEVIHGGTSKAERDRIFKSFQKEADPRVIVANPGTLSHGLTLTAANTIIWYAPTTSSEQYAQANARVTRPGQTKNTLIVHMEGTPVERTMYERLRNKQSMQGVLLQLLKGEV
jgi:SNF2 family DNA or RNA helicase